jgi:hypothetical protein
MFTINSLPSPKEILSGRKMGGGKFSWSGACGSSGSQLLWEMIAVARLQIVSETTPNLLGHGDPLKVSRSIMSAKLSLGSWVQHWQQVLWLRCR